MTTLRQIEANRRNAERSTGPRSDAGKERARRNAVKHGLAGQAIVLPDEEEAAVDDRLSSWNETLRPDNGYEAWLIEQMVIESVRIDCGHRHDNALRGLQRHRAQDCWNDDRRLAAEELALQLPKSPTSISRQLRQSTQGCEGLIERWEQLARIVESRGSWTVAQRQLALDMLGTLPDLREGPTRLDPVGEQSERDVCLAVARAEIESLQTRKVELLLSLNDHEQTAAALGVGADVGRPLVGLRRYLGGCVRRMHWAARQLESLRNHPIPELEPILSQCTRVAPMPSLGDRIRELIAERIAQHERLSLISNAEPNEAVVLGEAETQACEGGRPPLAPSDASLPSVSETVTEIDDEDTVSEIGDETVSEIDDETVSEIDDETVSEIDDETVSEIDDEAVSEIDDEDTAEEPPTVPGDSLADWVNGQRPRRKDHRRPTLKKLERRSSRS
jgi:hypothetical protein